MHDEPLGHRTPGERSPNAYAGASVVCASASSMDAMLAKSPSQVHDPIRVPKVHPYLCQSAVIAKLHLSDRPGTEDEDVHEPSCALHPARPRRDIGDADESPEQIEWIEVGADVTALDGSLHQSMNRAFD